MVIRDKIKFRGGATAILAVVALLLLTSCFTGIESTKKVKLSREDTKRAAPTAEEKLSRQMTPDTLKSWQKGRKFYVSDKRIGRVLRRSSGNSEVPGDTLEFIGVTEHPSPAGQNNVWLTFSDGDNVWEFDCRRPYTAAMNEVTSMDIPMLIDLSYVKKIENLLNNREIFIRTSEWYNEEGERENGLKYCKVRITGIEGGNEQFPLKVYFLDSSGAFHATFMSTGLKPTDSRPFHALFSLDDIRSKHKNITDETWEMIQRGKVAKGMTREECRLSLGSPSQVETGRTYTGLLDTWIYGDGKYLKFEDGLLVDFRL